MLLATVVAIITCLAVANATQTITTPNAVKITYSLAALANSAAITPAANTSVLVMGCNTTVGGSSGDQGVGHVSLLHTPTSGAITGTIWWMGFESWNGVATATGGNTSSGGIHIVFIDGGHSVDIRTASADTIVIHSLGGATHTGNVTLIW